jgi:hypothetical protein
MYYYELLLGLLVTSIVVRIRYSIYDTSAIDTSYTGLLKHEAGMHEASGEAGDGAVSLAGCVW